MYHFSIYVAPLKKHRNQHILFYWFFTKSSKITHKIIIVITYQALYLYLNPALSIHIMLRILYLFSDQQNNNLFLFKNIFKYKFTKYCKFLGKV